MSRTFLTLFFLVSESAFSHRTWRLDKRSRVGTLWSVWDFTRNGHGRDKFVFLCYIVLSQPEKRLEKLLSMHLEIRRQHWGAGTGFPFKSQDHTHWGSAAGIIAHWAIISLAQSCWLGGEEWNKLIFTIWQYLSYLYVDVLEEFFLELCGLAIENHLLLYTYLLTLCIYFCQCH